MNKHYIIDGKSYSFDNLMNLHVADDPRHASGNRVDRLLVRLGTPALIILLIALANGWI